MGMLPKVAPREGLGGNTQQVRPGAQAALDQHPPCMRQHLDLHHRMINQRTAMSLQISSMRTQRYRCWKARCDLMTSSRAEMCPHVLFTPLLPRYQGETEWVLASLADTKSKCTDHMSEFPAQLPFLFCSPTGDSIPVLPDFGCISVLEGWLMNGIIQVDV